MADINNNPNARYDNGPHAAGAGRVSPQATLAAASVPGLASDSTLAAAPLRSGLHAAGVARNNTGPHVAGAPRSYGNT